MKTTLLLAFSAMLSLSACSTVSILQPRQNDEVTGKAAEIILKLNSNAEPGTLRVYLDGTEITDQFTSSPSNPNKLSATPVFRGLYLTERGDYIKNVNTITARAMRKRSAESTTFVSTGQSINFNPSLIRLCVNKLGNYYYSCSSRLRLELIEGEDHKINVFVRLDAAPASILPVTVTPSNRDIVLNNAPAGTSINIEIPTNDTYAVFTLRRISSISESTTLSITAKGYGEARIDIVENFYNLSPNRPSNPPPQ